MARYNPAEYDNVETRIKRFYADHPDGRIVTKNKTKASDRAQKTWVVKAEIWLPATDEGRFESQYLKATGWAFEVDGGMGANQTSALENCETSAIGRALANAGYSGNKRASLEEMQKTDRGITPGRDWLTEADVYAAEGNLEALRLLFADATAAKADKATLDKIKSYGATVAAHPAGKSAGIAGTN